MYYVLHTIRKNIYLCIVKNHERKMKRILFFILTVTGMAIAVTVNAKSIKALPSQVTGAVADSEGAPIAYATVIAMRDGEQAAGTTTDDNGAFAISLPDGDYHLVFDFLGYKSHERALTLRGSLDLGTITLETDAIKIEGVEVTAQIIRREADRFVVDVANMPASIGKDGVELLQTSPGVFINDDKITINGQTGTKVYVNEREVKYTGDRLLNYLRGLKSNEIQKIEVVPVSGADYDADSSAGIIKITLKHKRDDGLMGSAGINTDFNSLRQNYSPSASIDYRTGKWTLSASGYYYYSQGESHADDRTVYPFNDNELTSKTFVKGDMTWYNAKAGAIYEINDRHSLGAEVEFGGSIEHSPTETSSRFFNAEPLYIDESNGFYNQASHSNSVSAHVNYIAKLDSLGSIVKILADYTHQQSGSGNDYSTSKQTTIGDYITGLDSLYRDNSGTNYNLATVSIAYEKVFSPKFTLKTGGKYNYNLMESFSKYDYLDNGSAQWMTRPTYNYDVGYTENIAAAYIIGTARLGRWGITAGLRGEYTNTSGRNNVARQNYFSLFPNANISFGLTKDQSYMLIGQYSRNISRPNFWALNPARSQISEYLYQTGNPNLTPAFTNRFSLSLVMKYKYTITLMANTAKDQIQQVVVADEENPNINCIGQENLDRVDSYGIAVNLPFQFTKWWSANFNAVGGYTGTRIHSGEPQVFHPMTNWSASMTFTLPLQFYLTVDYFGMGKMYYSNVVMDSRQFLSLSVKKRLFKDKLSLMAGVRNLLPMNNNISYSDDTFERTLTMKDGWMKVMGRFSITYNFNSGKKFNKRSIESDADADRLSK